MRILVIDNYDSFVYNIAQFLGSIKVEPEVIRNDKITISAIKAMNPDAIFISPGPGHPADRKYFGICNDIIIDLGRAIPIMGICLGHQGIVNAFGGRVINANNIVHGKTSTIEYTSSDELFNNVANPFKATRYHSLVAEKNSIPSCLEVTARSLDDGEIMAIKHRRYLIEGVQFHPESVLTQEGPKILNNFISMIKR
jgi:anthranilate synthase component II